MEKITLTRRVGESIQVGETVFTVAEIKPGYVTIHIEAPPEVLITEPEAMVVNETAVNLAEAIKRILAADEGQLSERLEKLLSHNESLTGYSGVVFESLCGASLGELLERLK